MGRGGGGGGGSDQLDSPSPEDDVISMRGSKSLLTVVQHCIYVHASSVSITTVLINTMKGAYSQSIRDFRIDQSHLISQESS